MLPHHIYYYDQGLLKSRPLPLPTLSLGLHLILSPGNIYLEHECHGCHGNQEDITNWEKVLPKSHTSKKRTNTKVEKHI